VSSGYEADCGAAVPVVLLMGQSDQPALRSVTAVRHWSLKNVTRVAIEVSGTFEFRTDRLHNPDRVYFDILNSHLRIDAKRFYVETVDDSLLQKIRVAEATPGTTRVVLDLTGNATATTSTLTNPDRLIIELRMPASNPLRTEALPTQLADHTAVTPFPSSPPPQPAVVKPVSAPAKVAVKADVHTDPDTKVPGVAPDAVKPAEVTDSSASNPAFVPAFSPAAAENHSVPDPGPDEIAKAARHTTEGTNSLIRA